LWALSQPSFASHPQHRLKAIIKGNISEQALIKATLLPWPHPSATPGPGLAIQHLDRMCMFQAKPQVGVVIELNPGATARAAWRYSPQSAAPDWRMPTVYPIANPFLILSQAMFFRFDEA
jgi:hypothetical protein